MNCRFDDGTTGVRDPPGLVVGAHRKRERGKNEEREGEKKKKGKRMVTLYVLRYRCLLFFA